MYNDSIPRPSASGSGWFDGKLDSKRLDQHAGAAATSDVPHPCGFGKEPARNRGLTTTCLQRWRGRTETLLPMRNLEGNAHA